MNVMCVHGTMYFEEHISDAKLAEKCVSPASDLNDLLIFIMFFCSFRNNIVPRHRLQMYYGYAFESYCTSLYPSRKEEEDADVPGWGGDVNTSVQWCSVVKTKLGNTRMVIGGEVDCVRGKYAL
jgi:RAT1-interacting protein